MKEIYDKLSKFYEREIARCKTCGGSGVSETILECLDGCNKTVRIPTFKRFNTKCSCGEGTLCITKYEECPTCAPLRERLKGLCWHEWKTIEWYPHIYQEIDMEFAICWCGNNMKRDEDDLHVCIEGNNFDLTTHLTGSKPTVRVLLEDAGLWNEFLMWNKGMCLLRLPDDLGVAMDFLDITLRSVWDILTDLTCLCQAVDSFLQEVNSG